MERFIKTHKVVLVFLIILLVVGTLAGCVSIEDENTNSSEPETTNLAAEISAPATKPSTENANTPSTEPSTEQPEPSDNPTTDAPTTAPSITFTDVNETVYAIGTVNVRSGPGTDHKKLGQLKNGDSIKRKGIGDNGWSRVEYDGQVAYVFSSYLSTIKPSGNTGGTGTTAGSNNSTGATSDNYVGRADPSTGLSWDGVSPIIYTYPDGTTGTEPKVGATYESRPGVMSTYTGYVVGSNATGSVDGVFYCESCGKVCGDGSNGTCVNWLTAGNHTCSNCGETVPAYTCHTCNEG